MKNIKRKNIYWITGVAFGLIVVMLLSFLFQQLGAPISTYEKEQNVPVPCGTFLDMRSKAKEEIYGITLSDEDKIEAEKKLENDLKNILVKLQYFVYKNEIIMYNDNNWKRRCLLYGEKCQ